MPFLRKKILLACLLGASATASIAGTPATKSESTYDKRELDWRNGAIVYQVLVDRFVPSNHLDAKRQLYPAPKVLHDWSEPAKPGVYLPEGKLNSAELDFWGGDLQSLSTQLDYIKQLGADVLYLNPIHLAYTNHKYDALDFMAISPEYGTRAEFKTLAVDVHQRGMKLVLDGVFNHMGRNSEKFQDAFRNPASPWRNWFAIGPQYEGGARVWTGFQNLPELNLDNAAVRDYIYASPNSVVQSYLRDGADGWRLDTAFELGPRYLRDLTDAAHRQKPGSLVVGEIVNYPGKWLQSIDAVMNFGLRQIVLGLASEQLSVTKSARMTERLIQDAGIEPMLKSWMIIDNHDLPRIANQFPEKSQRRMVQAMQFTLPGAPNIYYGAELGMNGGPDPENRSPMRWDLMNAQNPELIWMKQLINLRKTNRALRVGDFRLVESEKLFAYERYTDKVLETVIVVVNPADHEVTERVMIANPFLMDQTPLVDAFDPTGKELMTIESGFLTVTVPARTTLVLKPTEHNFGGYSRYKHVS